MSTLPEFLAHFPVAVVEFETWGAIQLEVRTFLTDQQPPLEWLTSVRAIVRRADTILVVTDPDRLHILPGGRREPDETAEQTLQRELLEETGWEVAAPRLLGVK